MGSRRGKPNMTPEQERTFLQLVATTMYPAQAARKVGVSPQAISNRKRRDKRFADLLEQAESSAEFGLVAEVRIAAKKDWRAAAFLLERRWPERWARPEIRGDLALVAIDTKELAQAIRSGLSTIAKRHANFDEPDIDAQKPATVGAPAPPDDPSTLVTRS